jgi:hypothetical protein
MPHWAPSDPHVAGTQPSGPASRLPLDDATTLELETDEAALLDEVTKPPKPPVPVGAPPEPVAFPPWFTRAVMEHATASTGNEARTAREGDMAPVP